MSALLWNVSSSVDDPQFGLSDVFTWLDWGYSFGQECHRSDVCPQFLPQFFLDAQRNSIQDDVTSCSWVNPVVPSSCSTLRFMAHSSWLWTWPFSAWFCLGTWGPLGIPRVSEHHSLATLSLSIFLVGFPSPYPSRSAWEEMTVLCLVPKSCPRDVDAQRNN